MELIKFILESNVINFVIMLLIFVWLGKKINFSKIIDGVKENVIQALDKAKQEKELALSKLKDAENSVKNLDNEVNETLTLAKSKAEDLMQKAEINAKKRIAQIEANVERVIDGEEKTASSKLKNICVESSIKYAKKNILKKLSENPNLHEKYINDSINEIDRINL